MAINTSVDSIIPADWHGFVEPFHKSGSDKKYHFSPGGKDMIREPRP